MNKLYVWRYLLYFKWNMQEKVLKSPHLIDLILIKWTRKFYDTWLQYMYFKITVNFPLSSIYCYTFINIFLFHFSLFLSGTLLEMVPVCSLVRLLLLKKFWLKFLISFCSTWRKKVSNQDLEQQLHLCKHFQINGLNVFIIFLAIWYKT